MSLACINYLFDDCQAVIFPDSIISFILGCSLLGYYYKEERFLLPRFISLFISKWTYGFLHNRLHTLLSLFILKPQIRQVEAPSSWFLCPTDTSLSSFSISLLSSIRTRSRFFLNFVSPSPGISHVSKERSFLLGENGIYKTNLSARKQLENVCFPSFLPSFSLPPIHPSTLKTVSA